MKGPSPRGPDSGGTAKAGAAMGVCGGGAATAAAPSATPSAVPSVVPSSAANDRWHYNLRRCAVHRPYQLAALREVFGAVPGRARSGVGMHRQAGRRISQDLCNVRNHIVVAVQAAGGTQQVAERRHVASAHCPLRTLAAVK